MTRTIRITLDVGTAAADSCGDCAFLETSWGRRGRRFCGCPAWDLPDVTDGRRHAACVEAERED